jgi:hypothetical protein
MEEEPAQFARLHHELIDEWQPSTPTLRKLVLRLAYLMWRQERAQYVQDGMMVSRLEREMCARAQRKLDAASTPPHEVLPDGKEAGGLRQAPPSEAKFEQLLGWLEFLTSLLNAGDFSYSWETVLLQVYGTRLTLRGRVITEWARQLAHYFAHAPDGEIPAQPPEATPDANGALSGTAPVGPSAAPPGAPDGANGPRSSEAEATQRDAEASVQDGGTQHEKKVKDAPKGWKLPFDTIHTAADKDEVLRKLRRELAAEHCDVATEYQVYSTLNTDFPWNLRASLLAPQDKYWGTVIWQEQALGQQVETTLRMIVTLKARESPPLNPGRGSSRLQRRG